MDSRTVEPIGRHEADASAWEWYTPAELEAEADRFPDNVIDLSKRAIELVE
ncbi:MAG: hypothetical protein ACI8UR_000250 [Natronomonas sp.]|uniref:hypothetical protein n=1 Tax=Natronomonas sp. TaxID=2184060 RepID=UPI0039896174